MGDIRIILVSSSGASREAYVRALRGLGVTFDVAENLKDISENHNQIKYNGFLIDVPTLLRSGASDKAEVNLLIDNFPVLRLNYHPSGGIRGIPSGRFSGTSGILEDFLKESCRNFPARSLRGTKRANKILSVILNHDLSSPGRQIEKSVTINFSAEGGFFFSVGKWEKGDYVWIVVKDLDDKTPIKSQVQWVVPWGKKDHIPGIGVNFLNLSDRQASQIEELIKGKKV